MSNKKHFTGKYEFNSKEQADSKISALGTDEDGNPTHKHTIVRLGNIVKKQGTYDEDGNQLTAPTFSDKYHVDALWYGLEVDPTSNKVDHPYGWKTYRLNLNHSGTHSFFGIDYLKTKIEE